MSVRVFILVMLQCGLLLSTQSEAGVSDDAQCIPELHSVQSQPVCPGDNVVYSCTVQGTNATIWTGDAFFCPNQTLNATELSHFEPNATAECWPYMAMNNVTSHEDDCYTSILKFKAYVELNNTQILCLNAAGNETGNETFTLSSPPSTPRMKVKDCTSDSITLQWDPPYDGGSPITGYGISVDEELHECSYFCAVGPDVTEYQFTSLNLSQTYTFGLRADNCNDSQQGLYSKAMVTLGGPPGPDNISVSLNYDDSGLRDISIMWPEVEPPNAPHCPQPVNQYEITYSGDFSDRDYTFTVNPPDCFESKCSHSFSVPDSAPLYTVSVAARNSLGLGQPTVVDFIEKRNDMLLVEVNASSPNPFANCHFLCGFTDVAPCSVTYHEATKDAIQPNVDASSKTGTSGSELTVPLTSPLPPDTSYLFKATATGISLSIQVQGSFTTGNYSSECDPHDLLMGEQEDTVCANSSHGLQDTNGITVCYDSTAPGSSAVYGCAEDYYPEESNGSLENMVVCQVNGLWSDRLEFACLQNSKSGGASAAAIGGGIAGALILLLALILVAGGVIFVLRRRRKPRKPQIFLEYEDLHAVKLDPPVKSRGLIEEDEDSSTLVQSESRQLLIQESGGVERKGTPL